MTASSRTESTTHAINDGLTLCLSEDGHFLQAVFTTSSQREPIKYRALQELIKDLGYGELLMHQDAIKKFIEQYNKGTVKATINIAEYRNGEFVVKLGENNMRATLSLKPAYGGRAVTKDMLLEHLQQRDICFGINMTQIDDALQKGEVENIDIASGQAAEPGEDGYLESLIPEIKDRRPRIDNKGRAHYHDTMALVTVKTGDPIVKRIPAHEGKPGKNVLGETIPAVPGKPILFSDELKGVKVSQDDPDILISTAAGQPVIVENGAYVETTIVLNDVDLETGNIEFDGTIQIEGNITTGMSVKASGDIMVKGMVEEATNIEAGGNIAVEKGIIGRGALLEEDGSPGKGIARINCAGSIRARFIENAHINCGDSVCVDELIAHSDISAANRVDVGSNKSKRGHIMGGNTRAENCIKAEVLGSQASVNTKIECGYNQSYANKLIEANRALEIKTQERIRAAQAFTQLKKKPNKNASQQNKILRKLQSTMEILSKQIEEIQKDAQFNEQQVNRLKDATVIVSKRAYNSVEITIAQRTMRLEDETPAGTFYLENGQLKHAAGRT